MKFYHKRKQSAPTVIIVALIDILIVLLIFLIVTTTFKQNPAVRLSLPESRQTKEGVSDNNPNMLIVDIDKKPPYLHFNNNPLTPQQLEQELKNRVESGLAHSLAIRADAQAPFEQIIKVMDIAKSVNITNFSAFVKKPGQK
ncbi:MAG TPA: biopolymer transporter ExbD [Verrucomicrobiota bacterium]|nr:biopolymer transporter ExbD [Verrucomicrobiota bacterium]